MATFSYANNNSVVDRINYAVRQTTLNHVWSIDGLVYRKENITSTIGGAMVLGGIEDEADYDIILQGACKVKFTGQFEASNIAGGGVSFNAQSSEVTAMIEPIQKGEFEIQKHDRIALILPNIVMNYQVLEIKSPSNLPNGQSRLYTLQPLEISINGMNI